MEGLVKTVMNDVENVWEKNSVIMLMDLVSMDVSLATLESCVQKVLTIFTLSLLIFMLYKYFKNTNYKRIWLII